VTVCWRRKFIAVHHNQLLQRTAVCCWIGSFAGNVCDIHVQFQSQSIQQSINQFSNTQRYVATAGYDELRWTSVSNKLSPVSILQLSDVLSEAKCSLCLVAAFRVFQLSVLKVS